VGAGRKRWTMVEKEVLTIAAEQHGVMTRKQLLELGLSPAAIWRRMRSGYLRPVHRGVYLVGPITPARATEMAAVFAGGPKAVLSHLSALHVLGMLRGNPVRPVHVSIQGREREQRPGIRFHSVAPLREDEHTVVDGIPLTSPSRTLVDVASMLGRREIEWAVAMAEREGLMGAQELTSLPRRYSRRAGLAMIRTLIEAGREPDFTRSEAERRCIELFRAAGLPRPHTNVPVGPYELDLFWPEEGLAVEVDGWAHHSSRSHFEGDRKKGTWLRARGIEVIRLTWSQITQDRISTAVQVGQALALARARRASAATGPGRDERREAKS
jgi:predicted transcriptional regulator of viral defense system/very-short-patch-repair endonuclease